MLIHILIGFTKEDNKKLNLEYIKVLGFSKNGQKYLNSIKKELSISTTPIKNSLSFQYEIKAATIYDLVVNCHALEYEKRAQEIWNRANNGEQIAALRYTNATSFDDITNAISSGRWKASSVGAAAM
jgi:hypothetical protein